MKGFIGSNKKFGDCVIVGVYNTLAFLGRRTAYWKIEGVARNYFNYTPRTGFQIEKLQDFYKFWEIKNEIIVNTLEIEETVLAGNCVMAIINNGENKDYWHFILLKPGEGRTIEVLNDGRQWIDIVLERARNQLSVSAWSVQSGKSGKVAA